MNNENLLEKDRCVYILFCIQIHVRYVATFILLTYHSSLFDHMLRSSQRSHRKTYNLVNSSLDEGLILIILSYLL